MRRRALLLACPTLLAGCGFQLRKAPEFAFRSIAVPANTGVANELRRNLTATPNVQVVSGGDLSKADVILEVLSDVREKVVVGLNASGQVREFQLRNRLQFRLRTPGGKELIPSTELLQTRDVSFNESAVLAKEAEEGLLYRDMQTDLVQQLLRRLSAVPAI